MRSLDAFASAKLAMLEAASLRRALVATQRETGLWVERQGRRLLSFSCNDYLNLSHHPAVKAAATAAIARYGAGAGASRLVTGNHPLHAELETRLAALKETQAACVFGSGYLANLGIVPALVGKDDLILIDELAHACLFAGARLSGAHVEIFRHNDSADVEMLLSARRREHAHAMLLTDGVFSMDGDLAPLNLLGEICAQHDTWLMSDDAHGLGVLAEGRGSSFVSGTKAQVPLQMGTLSKALGSYGGYLCASKPIVDLIKTRARTLIYSTGLPPSALAAALAALGVIAAEPGLCELPLAKARLFCDRLGLPEPQSPIVPLIIGDAQATLAASRRLEDAGFLVVAIRPPSVPPGTARLRLAFTVAHEDADVIRLADLIAGDRAFRAAGHPIACLQPS